MDGDATARWGALKTIGVEEEPLHTMWIDLRRSHQDASDIDIAGMEFSRGVPLDLHAEGSSRMKLLTIGFDGLADEPLKPLWIDAIYMQEGGEWFRIATIACRCNITMTNSEIFSHRRTTLGSGDLLYLVSFPGNTEIKGHLEIVRLRARQNRFTAVMHYETNNWKCAEDSSPNPLCTAIRKDAVLAKVIDTNGQKHAGAILLEISEEGRRSDRIGVIRGKVHSCIPYLWNAEQYRYELTTWKAPDCKNIPVNRADSPPTLLQ